MLEVRDGTVKTQGFRCAECGMCPWVDHCYEQWVERSCVCLVRYTTGDTARRLVDAGHRSYIDLAAVSEDRIAAITGVDEQAAAIICTHARARVEGRPIPRGLSLLAVPPLVLHYDIETYGDLVYLHGLVVRKGDAREERSFMARRLEDECSAWHALLDYLADHEGAVIYTWTAYERGFADELWRKYGGNEGGWRVLDRGMVDLCQVVQEHFALPVATYGLKEVAPIFGFAWQSDDAGGLNSEAWYREWLEREDQAVINKLLEYNLDDVRAMEVVLDNLTGLSAQEGMW